MKLSAGQFAQHSGLSTVTVGRYIKKGAISAEPNPNGKGWLIDASELDRVTELHRKKDPVLEPETPKSDNLLHREVEILAEKLAALETERNRERDQLQARIDDLVRRLDAEGEERRKLTAILTDQRDKPAPASEMLSAPAAAARGRGWWPFRWGTAANE